MKPIDFIFILIAIGIVAGVALAQHRKRSKGKPSGGCTGCTGCPSSGNCPSQPPLA